MGKKLKRRVKDLEADLAELDDAVKVLEDIILGTDGDIELCD